MLKINGEPQEAAGQTLAAYLAAAGYAEARVAVELGGEIVPRAQYAECVLQDGDSLEIVSFVGGG